MTRLFILTVLLGSVQAEDRPDHRLLLIGIDGCRPDALKAAETPHLDSLIATGGYSDRTSILGDRYRKNDTISGPGWSSFLTGVWADKHGVHDNTFEGKNFQNYPHLFRRVKERWPGAQLGSFVDWKPIDDHIVELADKRIVYPSEGAAGYSESDVLLAREAADYLSAADPDVVMVYFGAVDETGHAEGFHPKVPKYMAAIERVDEHVGTVVSAMQNRPDFRKENWLVIVSTDHGGKGTGHGSGHKEPEILTTFMIVSGSAAKRGTIDEPTYVVDVAVTGLVHLGIPLKPSWRLDGRPVGLKTAPRTR